MNRYVKLSAALLAGMLVSGVAMGTGDVHASALVLECKYEQGNNAGTVEFYHLDFGSMTAKIGDKIDHIYSTEPLNISEGEYTIGGVSMPNGVITRVINRITGEFTYKAVFNAGGGLDSSGTCNQRTQKAKPKF